MSGLENFLSTKNRSPCRFVKEYHYFNQCIFKYATGYVYFDVRKLATQCVSATVNDITIGRRYRLMNELCQGNQLKEGWAQLDW